MNKARLGQLYDGRLRPSRVPRGLALVGLLEMLVLHDYLPPHLCHVPHAPIAINTQAMMNATPPTGTG